MIDITLLFILPNELKSVKEYFLKKYEDEEYLLKFVNIEDKNLVSEIKESDVQIIIIDKKIGIFTQDMHEDSMSIYFSKESKFNINKISVEEIKSYKEIHKVKKNLNEYNEYDSSITLIENIRDYLDKKIPEIEAQKTKPNIETTYLEAIKIKDYFSIKDMEIDDLKDKKEIYFVGENGDGKTVLLQAILLALKGDEYSVLAEQYIKKIKDSMMLSTIDSEFSMEYKKYKNVTNVFAYGINRNKINDKESEEGEGYSALFDTPSINRTTFLREPETLLTKESKIIDDFVVKLKDLMGTKLEIIRAKNEVKFKESNGENIEFEMLSEGYKTTLIWLCDLLSRLMENQKEIENLEEYKSIVLIDEVDLYLHPKWKYDFMYKLRGIFPQIQFIMTTHSLVTVLGASEDAVFYKIYKEDGNTKVSEQIDDISHYTANVLITSPLFNLESVKVRSYDKDERLSSDDYIYREIHEEVKNYMKNNPSILDDKLKQKVREELKKQLANLSIK